MSDEEDWDDAMTSLIEWEKEVRGHNDGVMNDIEYNHKDFEALMDNSYVRITDKINWVDKPNFKEEKNPDVYGVFTLTHVDQWSIGMEGDSFAGFMYVKVEGCSQWLKIPYDC